MYLESEELPYDPPLPALIDSTVWHEAWPTWCNFWHVVAVQDTNQNGVLDYCDWILIDGGPNGLWWYHVIGVGTDLVLYQEIVEVDIANAVSVFWPFRTLDTVEVYPEWNLPINVTVKNTGNLPYVGTVDGYYSLDNVTYIPMGPSQHINQAPCNGTQLTFYWDMKPLWQADILEKSIYFLKFNSTVYHLGIDGIKNITDTDEHIFKVKTRILGDTDGSNYCDVGDQRKQQLVMFKNVWVHTSDYLRWNSFPMFTDCDGDGDVDVGDQRKQQLHMFEHWAPP
jgi:hypothetical protein